jgi:hypothetical protein
MYVCMYTIINSRTSGAISTKHGRPVTTQKEHNGHKTSLRPLVPGVGRELHKNNKKRSILVSYLSFEVAERNCDIADTI